MSKERLEEFREFIDFMYESLDIEDHQRFIAISESMLKDGWFKWIYRYTKKQVNRVQELEDIIYKDERQAVLEGLYEQNKRYQEAIQKIKNRIKNLDERIERLSSEPQFYDRTKQIEGLCGVTLGLEEALEIIKEELEGVDND